MDLSFLFSYGLPGIAIIGMVAEAVWCRKNEAELQNQKTENARISVELEKLNEKMDLIVNHFLKKGLDK